MKRPTFLQGVAVAALLAVVAAAVITVVGPVIGFGAVVRMLIPALAFCYLLYLFSRTPERTGRATTVALWCALSLGTWLFAPTLTVYLLMHVLAVWLVRSLYFYAGMIPALADLGLSGFSVLIGAWAFLNTSSVFLTIWSFFLVQALFVAIPAKIAQPAPAVAAAVSGGFERARQRADSALRELIAR